MPFNRQTSPVKMVPLTLQIPAVAMATLEKAAEKNGFKPSHYAQMLFDAAFAVRVGIDKRQTPLDRELDEQVRLVFAHAGQGTPAAIGRAIGIPADRVERILAAWTHAASGSTAPLAEPEPVVDEPEQPEPVAAEEPATAPVAPAPKKTKATPKPAPAAARVDAPSAPPPPKAKDLPEGRFVIGDLTERQSTVFAQAVKRINAGEAVRVDDISAATGLKWHDVSSAFKTLMGRAILQRHAGTYVLTSRGAALVAEHLLTQQAA